MSSEASPTASSALCGEWGNFQSVRRADPKGIERAALGRQPGLQRPDRGERGVRVAAGASPPVTMRRKVLGRREAGSFTPRTLLARPQPGGRFQPRPAIGESVAMVER